MGDRLATIDMTRKVGAAVPGCCAHFPRGKLVPHLKQSRLGRGLPPYQVASWSIQPFGHNRHAPKSGGCCGPFGGWAGFPSSTLWHWQRPIPPYQVASWSIQPFGHNRRGLKSGGGCCTCRFWEERGPHLTQCGRGRGLTPYQVASWSIQPRCRQHYKISAMMRSCRRFLFAIKVTSIFYVYCTL